MLQSMGSQRLGHDSATEEQQSRSLEEAMKEEATSLLSEAEQTLKAREARSGNSPHRVWMPWSDCALKAETRILPAPRDFSVASPTR